MRPSTNKQRAQHLIVSVIRIIMPKREGVKLDQINCEEVIEGGDAEPTGSFQKASEDILQKRRIVRAKRSTTTTTAAPDSSGVNPFASIKIPGMPTASEPSSEKDEKDTKDDGKKEDEDSTKVAEAEDGADKVEAKAEETKKEESSEKETKANDEGEIGKDDEDAKAEPLKRHKTDPAPQGASPFADSKGSKISPSPFGAFTGKIPSGAASSGQSPFGSNTFSFGTNTSSFSFGNATGFDMITKTPGKAGFAESSSTLTVPAKNSETLKDTKILPETFEVQTGEEEEDCLIGPLKCKIFKYVPSTKTAVEATTVAGVPPSKSNDDDEKVEAQKEEQTMVWKSFGIGEVKVLQHKETKNVRVVQRNGPTVVLNDRLKETVKMTLQGENEVRLNFLDRCNMVALKVNKGIFSTFVDVIRPHVSASSE